MKFNTLTRQIVTTLLITAAAFGAAGCGTTKTETNAGSADVEASTAADVVGAADTDKTTIKYGKAAGPYTVLFEEAIKPILEKEGYTVEAVDFSDLLQSDIALNDGEIDFNVEQHTAYAQNFNGTYDGDLVPVSPIPTVPAGIFSAEHKSLDELEDGDTIAVPNDAANTARAYALLQKAGWIKLDPDKNLAEVTQADIVENPHNLEFVELSSSNIPATLSDFSYAVITGSIVYNAGIDPSTALLNEDILDHLILQVVVKEENKDAKWTQAIINAYHSDEFKQYLDKNNDGLWYVPDALFE